jgi:hypothetical protein
MIDVFMLGDRVLTGSARAAHQAHPAAAHEDSGRSPVPRRSPAPPRPTPARKERP